MQRSKGVEVLLEKRGKKTREQDKRSRPDPWPARLSLLIACLSFCLPKVLRLALALLYAGRDEQKRRGKRSGEPYSCLLCHPFTPPPGDGDATVVYSAASL